MQVSGKLTPQGSLPYKTYHQWTCTFCSYNKNLLTRHNTICARCNREDVFLVTNPDVLERAYQYMTCFSPNNPYNLWTAYLPLPLLDPSHNNKKNQEEEKKMPAEVAE